ncbi:hypothetical protein BDV32DRAFT_25040 [Aspergillus pseudonomiae]|uniref:Uncharacterized protein n=1 Tax=Aspergillus pseudonomiae TaxID=1506151 RepID=A0A5N7CSN6_9EURO|nr:uncharacterized protein BDV37DRAFT_61401 [Aspergillus pseudonomiae]KAB8253942.1 hypothetical protein BDV32DRAFT_25040 [Aspergillus pseudonomiae]KAE8397252.1 hypothetical protein BDV37DRAFT_61401 [Aspergillus pseudonomiae]
MTIGESAARDLRRRRTKENRMPNFEARIQSNRFLRGIPWSGSQSVETHIKKLSGDVLLFSCFPVFGFSAASLLYGIQIVSS